MEISQTNFNEWLEHPVTKEVFSTLLELREMWEERLFEAAINDREAMVPIIGRIAAYDDLLRIELGDSE